MDGTQTVSIAASAAGYVSGSDTLDYSAFDESVRLNLGTGRATAVGGFDEIEAVVGGAGDDTLVGAARDTLWNIDGSDAGDVSRWRCR